MSKEINANNVEIETTETTEATTSTYKHIFKKPFEYGGEIYTELTFDFESLNGKDMLAVELELQNANIFPMAAEISANLQCKLAAKAAKIGSDVLEAMPLKEFNKITNAARDFLLNSGY